MYVRAARNRDEVWLLEHIEEMNLDEAAFRSRDYVIAIDEETNERTGFGRIRIHKTDDGDLCELTSLGVLEGWRGQGVGAHVVERLVQNARDEGFEELYALVGQPAYLEQFGFDRLDEVQLPEKLRDRLSTKRETIEPDAVPLRLDTDRFRMPDHRREAFKRAGAEENINEPDEDDEETAEDFGIDPDQATYKYDTGS
ncbi:MAG: GNAT family N-acetyltransferase [Halobacteriales archaeon]|nr:GNAT family N-acetyltransferase [Halobacteriales archaeon]